jgi:intergrase/recombinase
MLGLKIDKQRHVLASLSALSKFLGIHEDFKALVSNYGLKWNVRNDDLIIARFCRASSPDELFEWIHRVKMACPELRDFVDLVALTGLRYGEAVESYNLIIKLSREEKLSEYYGSDRGILQHYRFKQTFLRRTKKAFISFAPNALVERIAGNEALNSHSIQTKVKRKTGDIRFGDMRELNGTLLTRHLSASEIDFLQGRVSGSVFMRNYFNPALISDLRERVFKAMAEINELT